MRTASIGMAFALPPQQIDQAELDQLDRERGGSGLMTSEALARTRLVENRFELLMRQRYGYVAQDVESSVEFSFGCQMDFAVDLAPSAAEAAALL